MPDGDSERDRLLAEIGIDPLQAPPPAASRPPAALPLPPSPLSPPPPAAAPPVPRRLPRRLFGAVMAFAGAAWVGVGAATASPSALAVGLLLLLPGCVAWKGRGAPERA